MGSALSQAGTAELLRLKVPAHGATEQSAPPCPTRPRGVPQGRTAHAAASSPPCSVRDARARAVFPLAGGRIAAALSKAGGCGIVSNALAAVSQPLCWIFGVHCIKHAVRLRCSCLWSTSRCAPQRRTLELHQGADGSGAGPVPQPVDVLNESRGSWGQELTGWLAIWT